LSNVSKNPKRFDPAYDGEELQLAGMVWFQGIVDSMSKEKATTYEKNLACLIRDLRNDLKAPKLPVVVVSSPHGKVEGSSPKRAVFDAQMAVGNPEKYPEFAGNVISVDTTPFYRSQEQSPGYNTSRRRKYYEECFNSNAESFLLIGEAVGKAMIPLLGDKE
jgi:hypothetical protein